ncbi:MAG: SAM-dependent methyltransferase [Ferruginibacter sp.]|nr:SAM-dependent methyltransferase [Ferruginibacter sp.]
MNLTSVFGYSKRRKNVAGPKTIVEQYSKISFSQSGEDLIVKYIFDCLAITHPSYIDIGAHHPFYLSNTALLYQNGSRGINIEPDPTLFMSFKEYRKLDINLNIGISDKESELDFYIISTPTLNTFAKDEAEKYANEGDYSIEKIQKIKVNTLQHTIDNFSYGRFPDFLSVDAEGIDELIVKSINFNTNFPKVICMETISFSTKGRGTKNSAMINYLIDNGYLVYADTNINTIFVRNDIWER